MGLANFILQPNIIWIYNFLIFNIFCPEKRDVLELGAWRLGPGKSNVYGYWNLALNTGNKKFKKKVKFIFFFFG